MGRVRKKDFSQGIDAIFGGSDEPSPAQATPVVLKDKVDDAEVRTTVVLSERLMERAKAVAFWERKAFKDLFSEALESLLKSKECEYGEGYVTTALESYRCNQ